MPIKVPTDIFLKSIEEKKVYYFSSTQINTAVPHHYVCIKRTDDDILIMSCCTKQYNTVKRFVELNSLPFETLVWISPADESNPFTVDTYVNCNNAFTYTIDEFRTMYDSDNVNYSGEISLGHYSQILTGLHCSPLIETDTKELLPNPEDL